MNKMAEKKHNEEDVITYAPQSDVDTALASKGNTCVSGCNSDVAKVSEAVVEVAKSAPKVAEDIRKTDEAYAKSDMNSSDKKDVLETREKEKTKRLLIMALSFVVMVVVGILTAGRVKLKLNS